MNKPSCIGKNFTRNLGKSIRRLSRKAEIDKAILMVAVVVLDLSRSVYMLQMEL